MEKVTLDERRRKQSPCLHGWNLSTVKEEKAGYLFSLHKGVYPIPATTQEEL